MDLKLLLQYPKAVQVLLAALQKSPASLPKLEKLLPPEIPAAALLSDMEQAGFLTKTGSRYVLQQEALEHSFSRRPTGSRNTACNACHRTRLF